MTETTAPPRPGGEPPTTAAVPVHAVPTTAGGGIELLARQLAAATGATVVDGTLDELDHRADSRAPGEHWHLHFSDRLFGRDPADAGRRIARWAARAPLTVTLHDVPQAWGPAERQRCYLDVARASTAWAVSSHHEVRLVGELRSGTGAHAVLGGPGPGQVFHLPVIDAVAEPLAAPAVGRRGQRGPVTLGVLGWIYPDKGHREVLRAASRLVEAGRAVTVACLGAAVAAHQDLVEELEGRAERGRVRLVVAGFLADDDLVAAMRAVDVPVTGHRHLSASGSIGSWIAAGRRPLVPEGRYAAELAALRPGTVQLYDGAGGDGTGLDRAVESALNDPASTWLAPGLDLAPRLEDTASAYRAWWAATTYAGPPPVEPVLPAW